MRLAPLALLAACSSTSPKPKDRVAVTLDAAPVVTVVAPDASPPMPAIACVPADARLTAYVDDALVMCADTCVAVTAEGAISEAAPRPEFPSITIADSPMHVDVCTAADACKKLQPNVFTKKGYVVVDAALDATGARAVIALQDPAHLGPGELELWDVAKGKRLGHGGASGGDPGGVDLDVGFAGATVVSVAHGRGEGTHAYFLKLTGSQLTEVDHVYGAGTRGWAALPDGAVALLDEEELRIVEVKPDGTTERRAWKIFTCR